METPGAWELPFLPHEFLPYLWGMETPYPHPHTFHYNIVLTVPMRNGNEHYKHLLTNYKRVLTVPMRNGNLCRKLRYVASVSVLTVPMRNGNNVMCASTRRPIWVLTVPMRNGNNLSSHLRTFPTSTFLPYLWGMETEHFCLWTGCYIWFLPYLWGMETKLKSPQKLNFWLSSYRTYEEWKLLFRGMLVKLIKSSYRTYEEWKLEFGKGNYSDLLKVLTVPMRNGNFSSDAEFNAWYFVLTVPMRNGNIRYSNRKLKSW